MARKPLHVQRRGIGTFPVAGQAPAMLSVTSDPLHSSDEWEAHGRPFWVIGWLIRGDSSDPPKGEYLVSRTMTPTYCPLAMIGIPPLKATGVYCGACGEIFPAEWQEIRDFRQHNRLVGKAKKYNPITLATWDRLLNWESAQMYAEPGNIYGSRPVPVSKAESQYMPPPDVIDTRPEEVRMVDEGCPNTKEDE